MTLYEIDKAIYTLFDEETGELKDYEAFEQLNLDRDKKIENIALYYKDLSGDAKKIKAEKENLENRQKQCEKKAESLKKLLEYALQGSTFKSDKVNVSYRKSERCVIEDEESFITLHPEYIENKPKIMLAEIKEALKTGEMITGAEIISSTNIQIK